MMGASGAQGAELRKLAPYAGAISVALTRSAGEADMLRELEMEVGKSLAVRTDYRVKRVSVGDPRIADVVVLGPRELQFVAKGLGATNVLLWDAEGHLQVLIDVHVGRPYSNIASKLRDVLESEQIDLESVGDSVVLRGNVSDAGAMDRALAVTRAFLTEKQGERLINMLEVGGGQQVMLEVVIAEMSRTLTRSLGTNFHAVIGSDGKTFEFFNFLGNLTSIDERSFAFDLSSFELTALETLLDVSQTVTFAGSGFGLGTGLYEIFFDLLESNGLAKVLAEPTLVARSGETARFLSGGEVAIPVAQGGAFGSITVEFKPFGVGVEFTPTVLSPGRIHLTVAPEVSEPDFALGTAVDGTVIPGFRTRRASTGVVLGDGQSFAIAGLLRDDISELVDEYPVLGRIPILGGLFRSSSFRSQESELVIIVTPHIVKPLDPGPRPLPTDHFIEPSSFEFYLLGRLEAGGEPESVTFDQTTDPDAPRFGGLIGGAGQRVESAPGEEE
jgi:pilus assembly protein CpaC